MKSRDDQNQCYMINKKVRIIYRLDLVTTMSQPFLLSIFLYLSLFCQAQPQFQLQLG